MDDARGRKCSGGQISRTSMGGRLRGNTSLLNRPTLSPLNINTNDTPRWIGIGQLGADYTRSNNNYSRHAEITRHSEDDHGADGTNR